MRSFNIAHRKVGGTSPTFVIAEMSCNHLGDLQRAKKIIQAAYDAGADAIKLQTYRPDTMTIDCDSSEFMATPGSPWEGTRLFDLYKTAYTPWEWHAELFETAKQIGIICFSSPFDPSAVDFLESLNSPPPAYKIASYEIRDIPLIKRVAATRKPVIISTGIANISDIDLAVETCRKQRVDGIALLKCVTAYPTDYAELNLATIPNMAETFDCVTGLSDHSLGSCAAIAATALGSKIIEKHLTLSRSDGGPDAAFSMEPDEFAAMVKDIRNTELAIGRPTYELSARQQKSRERSRSLYASKDIRCGETFSSDNVRSVRPGFGLHPKYLDTILGKRAKCDIAKGTALAWHLITDQASMTGSF